MCVLVSSKFLDSIYLNMHIAYTVQVSLVVVKIYFHMETREALGSGIWKVLIVNASHSRLKTAEI